MITAARWATFGDFADDAFIGLLIFFALPLAVLTWWVNRKGATDETSSETTGQVSVNPVTAAQVEDECRKADRRLR